MSENERQGADPATARSLKTALVRARNVEADRQDVIADLREVEIARLEVLARELEPVFQDIPDRENGFECRVVAGARPRLWIDMLGFVDLARDKRKYRLVTETRGGRQILFESDEVRSIADSVTNYIAHRVVERDRAMQEPISLKDGLAGTGSGSSDTVLALTPADHRFWPIAFAFSLGLCFGIVGLLVLALFVTG